MADGFRFDPDRVAYFEAAGWRAYYEWKWLKLLRLTIALCQQQFNIPFPRPLLAAYDVTHGAADKSQFLQTLIALHSAIFGLTTEEARESAELRPRAANTVDEITGGRSTDVERDWAGLEEDLRRCYRSIDRALAARNAQAGPPAAPSIRGSERG